jgi:hypothetical protein
VKSSSAAPTRSKSTCSATGSTRRSSRWTPCERRWTRITTTTPACIASTR